MKKTNIIVGMCSLMSFGLMAQGPSEEVSNERLLNGNSSSQSQDNEVHYSVEKTDFNSKRHPDFGGYVLGDQLYFLSARKSWAIRWRDENKRNFLDLYSKDMSDAESKPKFIGSKVNRRLNEGPICFTKDGSRVYYTRDYKYSKKQRGEDGKIHLALYTARIENGSWVDEQPLSINSINYSVGHPVLSNDGKTLYFVSNQLESTKGTDIYQATVLENGNVSDSKSVEGDVNTSGNEMFPFIGTNDELYFSSTQHGSTGGLDVFIAKANGEGFSNTMNVGAPVNSPEDDFAYTVSSEKKGYFSSNRDGNDDVYEYDLLKPFRFNPVMEGQVAMEDGSPQAGVTVELFDENGTLIDSQVTDENGNYSFDLEDGKKYTVRYSKDEYVPQDVAISTNDGALDLSQNISLEKDNGIGVYLLITESGTAVPVEGVTVEMIDLNTGETFMSEATGVDGMVSSSMKGIDVNDNMHLDIKLTKDGYLTKEVTFNHTLENRDDIPLHKFLQEELKMDKIDLGKDVGQMIDVKPIYFDLGKYNIREDAADELDKIVLVMENNKSIEIELGSHTDARGSSSSNLRLSDKRAKASADYVISKGIDASRISGKGYGESNILNECKNGVNCSENQHQENRRTEFLITKM